VTDVRDSKERGWREVTAIDAAYERGELDDDGWHRAMAALIVPAYLAGDVRRASGHTGTAEDWEYSRGIVAELLPADRPLTFLDVGCANGLLMESVARWRPNVSPYGLDISPELAALARSRLPQWADRIFVGNALTWVPPHRFDIIRTGLEYVPRPRRPALVSHLLASTDLLIIGKYNEELADHIIENDLRSWGFAISHTAERPHRHDPRVCYRVHRISSSPLL
jgi:SAM-dependent methyltransferase